MMFFRSGSEAERIAVIEDRREGKWRGGRRGRRDGDERGSQWSRQVNIAEHVSCLANGTTHTVTITIQYHHSIKVPQASRIFSSPPYPSWGIASLAMILVPSFHLYCH